MRRLITSYFLILGQLLLAQTRYDVSSEAEFKNAHDQANAGDSIVWGSGTYIDVFMDIIKDGLVVTAEKYGLAIFTGASKVEIHSDDVTLSGLQFLEGNIRTNHVIRIWGSDVLVTQINIKDYTSYKYLIVDDDSKRTTISYSNFENRLNQDDQNILSVLVGREPGYHKIQYCSFKNFKGTGNDLGIEPIRIGVSSQADFNSRTIVEYCYFTNCDGDGEIISNKAAQNVIRYNTFENNSRAELVLRHGDDAIVYGNFFLNNMGGVRVREGNGHFIYNNYFSGLGRRAIYLQNDPIDPLRNIHIYHNTFINSSEFILGGDGSDPPQNVTIANNIFAYPQDVLFEDATGNETWIGNISYGSLGIARPSGLVDDDPKLSENRHGYFQPDSDSPIIDAAEAGYPIISLFEGMEYDNELMYDLMKEQRPATTTDHDIGASEYSASVAVQPHANEKNTGPIYLSIEQVTITKLTTSGGRIDINPASETYLPGSNVTITAIPKPGFTFSNWTGDVSGTQNPQTFFVNKDIQIGANFSVPLGTTDEKSWLIFSNPVMSQLIIKNNSSSAFRISLEIFSNDGKLIIQRDPDFFKNELTIDISDLTTGLYYLKLGEHSSNRIHSLEQVFKFMKN